MKPLVPAPGVLVAWKPSAFGDEVFKGNASTELSIKQILRCVPGLPDRFFTEGIVFAHAEHDGQGYQVEIKRELWENVRWHSVVPVPDAASISLTLHLPPGRGRGGGGQGKSTFSLVASIALIAATSAISGGALAPVGGGLFTAGSISARIAAGAVGIIGALAVTALSAPPTLDKPNEDRGDLGSASADGNILQRAGVIPRVIGTFRTYPNFASPPVVELVGDDEWVEAVYCMNGPHRWADIRVDGVAIDEIEGVSYETKDGFDSDTALTLVARRGFSEVPTQELSRQQIDLESGSLIKDQTTPANSLPVWHNFVSRQSPDQVWFHLFAPEGFLFGDTPDEVVDVPVRIRVRARGETTWINLPEVHFSWRGGQSFRKAVILRWDELEAMPEPVAGYGPVRAFAEVPTQDISPVGTGGWTASSPFVRASGDNNYEQGTETTTKVRNVALYEDRVEFFLGNIATDSAGLQTDLGDPIVQPSQNRIEVQFKRGQPFFDSAFDSSAYEYSTDVVDFFGYYNFGGTQPAVLNDLNAARDKLIVTRVQTIQEEHPIGGPGLALLAVKVKNKALQRVSALLSGVIPDWNGSAWTGNNVTSNPAPHLRYLWAGAQTADPLPEELIDEDALVAWRTSCAANGYEANLIADGQSIEELADALAGCGYARVIRSETYGVTEDKDRSAEGPVQVGSPITMRNFRWTKALGRLPEGLRIRYRDRDKDYEEGEEQIVYDEGFDSSNATRLEGVDYIGLTSAAEVEQRALFDLAQARLRNTFYTADVDAEWLQCRRGDLVGMNHDTIQHQAGFGRILEKLFDGGGLLSGIVLDSKVPCDLGGDFASLPDVAAEDDIASIEGTTGVAIRLNDGAGTVLVKEIDAEVEETETLMFAVPFTDPGDLDVGCHVVSGALGSEYLRLVIADMKPGPDLTWQLSMVDEAPDLFPPTSTIGQPIGLLLALTQAT